jgi:asparagine synthase (glutamine-hydrolysing)
MHLSQDPATSAYRDVLKLPPGHWLLVKEQDARLERYFHFRDDAPPATRRSEEWVEAYRALLEESIRDQMRSAYPLGSENSGGIDSATLTAYLADFLGIPGDRLFSFGFAHAEQEPAFILETSRVKRIVHNYIVTGRDPANDESIPRGLATLGYPEEHGNATSHIPFYREAQLHNIRTLFSGFGGDEVVTNPGHHLRWEMLDTGNLPGLWDILPGSLITRPLRLAKLLTVGRNKPAFNPNFLRAWNQRWPHYLVHPQAIERLGLHEEYMETARYDAPYRRINDFILQHHLTRMSVTTRLENCTLVAASYGIEYRWPLWDVRLVQQYLSTPSIEKVGPNGMGRYLHRRAIDPVVPKMVAWKPSKDMGYARVIQDTQAANPQLLEQARQHEAHLHPALQEIVDRQKLRQQIANYQPGKVELNVRFTFQRSIRALAWLNTWLYGGEMPG